MYNSANVVSGSAIVFDGGMTALHKQDLMHATLLAQLAAGQRYDRFNQINEWYGYHGEILQNIGCIAQTFQFNEHSLGDSAISVERVILEYLAAYMPPNQLSAVQRLLDGLRGTSDSAAAKIFARSAVSGTQANFQIGACTQDPDGNIMFVIGSFVLNTNEAINANTFSTEINRGSAKLMCASQTIIVNEQIYNQYRQAVQEKLGNQAKDLIEEVALPSD